MPKDTNTTMTLAEAERRKAVAEMIIAEIQVGEALQDASIGPYLGGYPGEGMVWHHKYGWLHPTKYLEVVKTDVEAGEITREEVAAALGVDLAEVDAENARDEARLPVTSFTALPEGFDEDTWPYAETESDQKPPNGLKKLVEENVENHLLSFYSTEDRNGSAFLAAWGAIRQMSFEHRDTLAFTLDNIAKTILSDIQEDRKNLRSASKLCAAVS